MDQDDGVLLDTAPSIIEGFPLAKSLPVFEIAAVVLSIGHHKKCWDGLKWLCLLNEIDPDEMAAALRELSADIRLRTPETGVHTDLPARVASLLLWLSGQEQDEDAAVSIDPSLDRSLTYEKDYLPRPSSSFFPLERRHADVTLNDTELPLFRRVQRTKELWLDPSFEPPAAFIAEVRAAVAHIEVDKLDRYSANTSEDHEFEELEPVLARCVPDLLADLIHRKIQSAATCPAESRYWSAICITEHLLLAGKTAAIAARSLRLSSIDADESQEFFAANHLLMIEIKDQNAQAQYDTLIKADLKSILLTGFAEILRFPTPEDVDILIDRYASGSSKQQDDLLILLSIHSTNFSDKAWSWIMDFAKAEGYFRGFAFKTLNRADAVRFGRILTADGWFWSPEAHDWVNHYGSGSLIEATRNQPFDQVAPSLAPWRLLEAAPTWIRTEPRFGWQPKYLGMYSQLIKLKKLTQVQFCLSIDLRPKLRRSYFLYYYRLARAAANDPVAWLEAAMDIDAQMKVRRLASETAISRIHQAQKSGACLYLAHIDAKDFEPVFLHASNMVDHWLEGSLTLTTDFRRRVHLAEGVFLALCEALLFHDPIRGSQLWRALNTTMTMRHIGVAGVEELLHMVFRAPDSPAINALREELIELENCHTDQALFDVAIAASYNGKAEWLSSIIERDRTLRYPQNTSLNQYLKHI